MNGIQTEKTWFFLLENGYNTIYFVTLSVTDTTESWVLLDGLVLSIAALFQCMKKHKYEPNKWYLT